MTLMIAVTLYTRARCSLCDKARQAIAASGVPVTLTEIDIDGDERLLAQYTNDVPVILVDGREAFRHRVEPAAFAAYVQGRSTVSELAKESCVPCRGGVPALGVEELRSLERELGGGWRVVEEHHLVKEFQFPDFATALAFTNQVGAIADAEGHHPDIHLAWGRVAVEIWTHKIDGLTRSDFVLAAKIDRI